MGKVHKNENLRQVFANILIIENFNISMEFCKLARQRIFFCLPQKYECEFDFLLHIHNLTFFYMYTQIYNLAFLEVVFRPVSQFHFFSHMRFCPRDQKDNKTAKQQNNRTKGNETMGQSSYRTTGHRDNNGTTGFRANKTTGQNLQL